MRCGARRPPWGCGGPNPGPFRPLGQLGGREVPAPESVARTLARSGSPMDPSVRGRFEAQLGADLSRVRVSTGGPAAQSARDVRARAYTVGRDVVFGTGQYAPGTPDGDRLLAHELAHVTQQEAAGRADRPGRTCSGPGLSDVLEAGAELVAGPTARDLVHSHKQFIDDVMASIRESPSHVLEFFSDEVWVQIKEHWLRMSLVTGGLVLSELAIGELTAAPEPFITKLLAVILQIIVIAVLGYFAAVEVKGAYEEGVRWLSTARQAKGDPAKITEASKAFVRMVWHVVMAVMVLAGIRARIKGFAAPGGAPAGEPGRWAGWAAAGQRRRHRLASGLPAPDGAACRRSQVRGRSGFGPGGTALKTQPDVEPVQTPPPPTPAPPVTKPISATGTGVKPGPGVQVPPTVAAGVPSPQPAPKKQPRPPFVLTVPLEKAIHVNRYRMWLGRLVSDPAYDRDDDPPAQLRKWHQAHRFGGSHAIPFEVLDRGHRLGLSGEQGEKRIRVPDWSRRAPMKMEVDHVIELQVAPRRASAGSSTRWRTTSCSTGRRTAGSGRRSARTSPRDVPGRSPTTRPPRPGSSSSTGSTSRRAYL